MDSEIERKFLHDIANPIFLLRIQVNMILDELEQQQTSEFYEKLKSRLEKIQKAADQLELLHGDHKLAISSKKKA